MNTPEELALELGFDLQELCSRDKELKAPRAIDRRICLCGHPVVRHRTGEMTICIPARWQCHCRQVQSVMIVEDTRVFAKKSYGYGQDHALLRSLPELAKRGKKGKWLEGLSCMASGCEAEEERLTPAIFEFDQRSGRHELLRNQRDVPPSIYMRKIMDALLCPAHLQMALEGLS